MYVTPSQLHGERDTKRTVRGDYLRRSRIFVSFRLCEMAASIVFCMSDRYSLSSGNMAFVYQIVASYPPPYVPTTNEITEQKERDEIKIHALNHVIAHLRGQAAIVEDKYQGGHRKTTLKWKRRSHAAIIQGGLRENLYWLGNEIRKREDERDKLIRKRLEWI